MKLPHPLYSPDTLPSDYYFFKHFDKGKVFNNSIAVQNAFKDFFFVYQI